MQASYLGKHRRNLTITTVIILFSVVAIISGVLAVFGVNKAPAPPSAVIGTKIDKSLGERKLLNASVWDGTSSTIWTKGSGTQADPYLIESAEHFAYLSNLGSLYPYNGQYFKQTVDIDLDNKSFSPIYCRSYDGDGFTLYNVAPSTSAQNIAIFADTYDIKNLVVDGYTVEGSFSKTTNIAVFNICQYPTVTNCRALNVNVDVENSESINSIYFGAVSNSAYMGYVTDVKVSGSINIDGVGFIACGGCVAMTAATDTIGIVIDGFVSNLDISVAGTKDLIVGGIFGGAVGGETIKNSKVDGTINCSGNTDAAGLISSNSVGGLIGNIVESTILERYSLTEIISSTFDGTLIATGISLVGGFVGHSLWESSELRISYSTMNGSINYTGNSSGTNYVGGLVGWHSDTEGVIITNSVIVNATITATNANNKDIYAGYNALSTYIKKSYYNKTLYTTSSSRTTAYTSAQMKVRSNFNAITDFDDYFVILPNVNRGFPILKIFLTYGDVNGFEGKGTKNEPFIINSVPTFLAFANYYNDDHGYGVDKGLYWQIDSTINELDLSTNEDTLSWRPIGYDANHAFTGHLIGNQTNVSNLVVDENYTYAGLFGNISSGASIEWLAVYGDVDYDIATYVGGLAGYVSDGASISNCCFRGDITGYLNTTATRHIGGLVGKGAEGNVTTSYAIATHIACGATTTKTENIESLYGVNTDTSTPVGDMKSKSTYDQFGFTFSDDEWKIDISVNDGYPYFIESFVNQTVFKIKYNITGRGVVLVTADGESVAFDDSESRMYYTRGVVINVEATADSNYAIESLIVNGVSYDGAFNMVDMKVNNVSTRSQSTDFVITVVFAEQRTLTIKNGNSAYSGSVTIRDNSTSKKILDTTNATSAEVNALINRDVKIETSTTDTESADTFISGFKIDSDTYTFTETSIEKNGTVVHTISTSTWGNYFGDGLTMIYYKVKGESQPINRVLFAFTLKADTNIEIYYGAIQDVETKIVIVGSNGSLTNNVGTPIQANWGDSVTQTIKTKSEINGITGTEEDYTFIGWTVSDQIVSQDSEFTVEIKSDTGTIGQLWAVLYDIIVTLPSGVESIQVTHMLTGLSYNISSGDTQLMAGEWMVTVPTGKTLTYNGGDPVAPDGQGRYIINVTSDGTITLS